MNQSLKFLAVPFRRVFGRLEACPPQEARSETGAQQLAAILATRYAGAIAVSVIVDMDTGEILDPCELGTYGAVPQDAVLAAA